MNPLAANGTRTILRFWGVHYQAWADHILRATGMGNHVAVDEEDCSAKKAIDLTNDSEDDKPLDDAHDLIVNEDKVIFPMLRLVFSSTTSNMSLMTLLTTSRLMTEKRSSSALRIKFLNLISSKQA